MFRSKILSLVTAAAILALAACADINGPTTPGFCPIGGGPGTCIEIAQR